MADSDEKLIREHWAAYRGNWGRYAKDSYSLRVPVHRPIDWATDGHGHDIVASPLIDTLTFTLEKGYIDGHRAYRIVCEGITVEDGPLL